MERQEETGNAKGKETQYWSPPAKFRGSFIMLIAVSYAFAACSYPRAAPFSHSFLASHGHLPNLMPLRQE